MRLIPTIMLAGAASLALAGTAFAASRHVMNVDLPDGAVAQIEYQGNVAPKVKVVPVRRMIAVPVAYDDPMVRMDAMFAAMERRHALMMRQAALMAARAEAGGGATGAPVMMVSTNGAPRGGSFTFVSTTTSGNGTCGHSVQVTQRAGQAAQRVERSFGDCTASAAPTPHATPRAAPSAAPGHARVPVQPVI